MRLGAPLPQHYSDPGSWIAALQERGYRAAYCPVDQRDSMVDSYLVNSPQHYYHNGALIREFVSRLGSSIKSCHARDVVLTGGFLPLHLDECRPGLGTLDYHMLLRELERVDSDMPLLLEHLRREEDYALGAQYIRTIAREVKVPL